MDIVVSILSTESITVTGPNHTVIDRIVYRPGQPGTAGITASGAGIPVAVTADNRSTSKLPGKRGMKMAEIPKKITYVTLARR